MKDKKKQTAIIVAATVLSVSSLLTPVKNVYAQESDVIINQQINSEKIKESAPLIKLPSELAGKQGQVLNDIALPERWVWTNGDTVITKEKAEYPARFIVDDETYDYSNIDGYNADGHYVVYNLAVTVKEQKSVTGSTSDLDDKNHKLSPLEVGDVQINEENFPDPIFRQYIIDNFDTDTPKNEVLSAKEISNITAINVNFKSNIRNLKGIEYFSELKSLSCLDLIKVESLDISSNNKLEYFSCEGSISIKELDVSENLALKHLNCGYTSISDIDLSNNINLTDLYLNRTGITSLNIQKNTALEVLNCIGIKKLSEIDVSKNPRLYYLEIGETNIKELDVSKNIALQSLFCDKTPLAWLNLGNNSNLKRTDLSTSSIGTNAIVDSFNIKDIAEDIDLEKITITNSNGILDKTTGVISSYDMNLPIQYEYDCGIANGKPVKLTVNIEVAIDIDATNFPDNTFREYVKEFDRDKNQKLSASEIANVTTLYADGINGKGAIKTLKGIEYFTSLKTLYCYNTQITELDVSNNTALTHLSCGDTGLLKLNVSNNKALEYLDCANTDITELNVSSNLSLKSLGCANTEIKELNVNANVNLEHLYIRNTSIDQLNISNNKKLTHLDCANTDITDLDLFNNIALIQLYCDELEIDELDITNNHNLTHVWCNDTKIEKLDVSNNVALTTLECYRTKLQSLDVSKNTELKILNCSQTLIKELDVTMLSKLEYLYTWATEIGYLNVSKNSKLILLDTPRTNLAYLDFGSTDLKKLYMDSSSTIQLTVNSNTFDITKVFKGIDASKITILSNGYIDKEGIVSGYNMDAPIIYTYNCGTSNGIEQTLNVTLNLSKSPSKIEIKGNLNTTYTGKPIKNPIFDRDGSMGDVTFIYEVKNGNIWEVYNGIPVNVGIYRVKAYLAEDNYHTGAESKEKEFTITAKTIDDVTVSEIKNDKDVENLVIKDGEIELVKGVDYDVERKNAGNKVIITITFKGNYYGTITKDYEVNVDQPKETGSVQTGDDIHISLLVTMSLLSVGSIKFLRKRKMNDIKKGTKGIN